MPHHLETSLSQHSSNHILEIDFLRAIAILAVILGHSILVHPVNLYAIKWCQYLAFFLYSFHVELLFLVAGYCYHCSRYLPYIIKKTQRILVPYFIFGTGALGLHIIGGKFINPENITSWEAGLSKLCLHGGGYWFLYDIFIMFALYPFLMKISKKPLLWFFLLIVPACLNIFPTIFNINQTVYYLLFFIIGHFLANAISSNKLFHNSTTTYIKLAGIAFILFCTSCYLLQTIGTLKIIRLFRSLSLIAIIISCVCTFPSRYFPLGIRKLTQKVLLDSSTFSLQLYLFNGYLLTLLRILLCSVLKIHSPLVLVLTIWIFDVFITLFICKYILPKSRFLSWICGIPPSLKNGKTV